MSDAQARFWQQFAPTLGWPPTPRMSDGSQLSDALSALQQLTSAAQAMLEGHERATLEAALQLAREVLKEHEPMQTPHVGTPLVGKGLRF